MPEVAAANLQERLHTIRDGLRGLSAGEASLHFQLVRFDQLWKSTISLCPACLAHVPGLVYQLDEKVLIRKLCPEHGLSDAVIENDFRYYRLSNKDRWGRRYSLAPELSFPYFGAAPEQESTCGEEGFEFADQTANKSCTILIEITDACNLACAVCYSDARGSRKLPFADFKKYVGDLIAAKHVLDSIQLTGGEAILHPEFWEMIEFLHGLDAVKKIYLPTNGLEFSKPEVAARLEPFKSKLMLLLQFDGAAPASNRALRNAHPADLRQRVIENLSALGIQMQLTMTITLGVNDHEIGWVIEMGLQHDHVKVVALQPVTYSGRYELAQDPLRRATLSDIIKAAARQVTRATAETDFKPIPCSHPNCGWITLFARRFGLQVNIARHIDLDRAMNQAANRTLLNTGELRDILGAPQSNPLQRAGQWLGKNLVRSTDVFAIAIKPFMDKYNYDQDRISACCHHLLDTQGRPVSFCEYNARLRPLDPWTRFPKLRD